MNESRSARADAGALAELLLPHLDSAYCLARWLVGNREDAEDVVQNAFVRAFQYGGTFRGGNARAWLLAIVRNDSYRLLRKAHGREADIEFDEEVHSREGRNPEDLAFRKVDSLLVTKALNDLPVRFREVLVLRELEGLSYKEISEVISVPTGTVMSRLSRARSQLRLMLGGLVSQGPVERALAAAAP